MPTYDYVCHHCGHRFEVIHGVHADGPATCPVCHKGPVRKGFSAPTIHFKGTGWAKKDRSNAARSKSGSASAGDKPATETPASGADAGGEGSKAASPSGDPATTGPASPAPTTSPAAD